MNTSFINILLATLIFYCFSATAEEQNSSFNKAVLANYEFDIPSDWDIKKTKFVEGKSTLTLTSRLTQCEIFAVYKTLSYKMKKDTLLEFITPFANSCNNAKVENFQLNGFIGYCFTGNVLFRTKNANSPNTTIIIISSGKNMIQFFISHQKSEQKKVLHSAIKIIKSITPIPNNLSNNSIITEQNQQDSDLRWTRRLARFKTLYYALFKDSSIINGERIFPKLITDKPYYLIDLKSIRYFGGLKPKADGSKEIILIYEKNPDSKGRRILMFLDGHIEVSVNVN